MVVINGLILLASEKVSHNLFNRNGDFSWSLTLGDDSKNVLQHF